MDYRLVFTMCEPYGGGAGDVPSRRVAAVVMCHCYSHKAVNIFRLRFSTLASKWVEQSWRAEWLMEIGTRGVIGSSGARFWLPMAGRKEVQGLSIHV